MASSSVPATSTRPPLEFEGAKHIKYFKRCLQMLPSSVSSMDTNRLTLAMFSLGGLELLGALEDTVSEKDRKDWIDWIYSQQRVPSGNSENVDDQEILAGFAGGSFSGLPFCQNEQAELSGTNSSSRLTIYDTAHITMTYAALVSLLILGDDLSRVAKEPIVRALKKLQQPNGCYIPCITDFEPDLRFLFCAAAISYILDDWSGMDREAAIRFIHECQTYEHAFSQSPRQEAHGGTTYCAVATLGLMGENACADQKTMTRDDDAGEDDNAFQKRKQAAGYFDKEGTKRWCLNRQTTGFQGRVNKPTDTCYSFWIGGALEIIGGMDLVNHECNRGFLLETQSKIIGGFSKWVDSSPDPLHSYMGIAALSLMGESGIRPINPLLNISKRCHDRLVQNTVFRRETS